MLPPGVGRLVAECDQDPLIIPMWHIGMDDVRPNQPPYCYFRTGQHITLLIGDPIDLKETIRELKTSNKSPVAFTFLAKFK
jgi:monolysocardiolipin acyltransferase